MCFSSDKLNAQSTHSSCEKIYFDTKKRVKSLTKRFKSIDFNKGDFIASIGADNGWFEGAASVYYDSLFFYLEDIDSTCLNISHFEKVKNIYSKIKGDKITNQFILTIGNEKSTELPSEKFDKVIMNMVFHHFSFKKEMLTEVKRIIKKEGKCFVMEAIIPKNESHKFSCNYYNDKKQLIKIFEDNGFALLHTEEIFSGGGTWTFTFALEK